MTVKQYNARQIRCISTGCILNTNVAVTERALKNPFSTCIAQSATYHYRPFFQTEKYQVDNPIQVETLWVLVATVCGHQLKLNVRTLQLKLSQCGILKLQQPLQRSLFLALCVAKVCDVLPHLKKGKKSD